MSKNQGDETYQINARTKHEVPASDHREPFVSYTHNVVNVGPQNQVIAAYIHLHSMYHEEKHY